MSCPFCDIEHEKTYIIAEKKHCYVALSNPRLMPGHMLVIPRRHMLKPSEMTPEERTEVFDTIIEYQNIVITKLAAGCDIRQNYRPFLQQSRFKIDHVHYHVLPREFEDAFYKNCEIHQTGMFQDLAEDERRKMAELLGAR